MWQKGAGPGKAWKKVIQKTRAHPSDRSAYIYFERIKCSGNSSYYNYLKRKRLGSLGDGAVGRQARAPPRSACHPTPLTTLVTLLCVSPALTCHVCSWGIMCSPSISTPWLLVNQPSECFKNWESQEIFKYTEQEKDELSPFHLWHVVPLSLSFPLCESSTFIPCAVLSRPRT